MRSTMEVLLWLSIAVPLGLLVAIFAAALVLRLKLRGWSALLFGFLLSFFVPVLVGFVPLPRFGDLDYMIPVSTSAMMPGFNMWFKDWLSTREERKAAALHDKQRE